MAQKHTFGGNVEQKRRAAYPDVGDAMDPLIAALEAISDKAKVPLPPETRAWIDARQAVKERFKRKP
jgi:hypothetical protein